MYSLDKYDNSEESYSDSDVSDNEKKLLKRVRNSRQKDSDSEDEVLGVDVTDSDDDKSDLAVSDVEEDKDDIPDIHAWGKDKRKFYSTDYVDPDYGSYQGKDAVFADQEEEEAQILQKELIEKYSDDIFSFESIQKDGELKTKLKDNEKELSKRKKLQKLQKDSPEFQGLIEDYKSKKDLVATYLQPILKLKRDGKVVDSKAVLFISTLNNLITNYSMNVMFYMVLKANNVEISNHSVISRLHQFRQLIMQMEPIFEDTIKPQVEIILKQQQNESEKMEIDKDKKKTLKLLQNLQKLKPNKKEKVNHEEKSQQIEVDENDSSDDNDKDLDNEEGEIEDEESRRPITYQIAKNKGLTPHRKKEQRNPRVKYKNKFRKATIRRKGAVRPVRTEVSRYGGEISGIKTTVSKGIKIKS